MSQTRRTAAALVLTVGLSTGAWPQTSDTERLLAEERVRTTVEEAFELNSARTTSGDRRIDNFNTAVDMLVDAGPDVVPYLINELEQALPETYFLCAFALGQVGTPESEAALRAAVLRGDRGKGDFALQQKVWAGHGLGLMGVVESLDLIQQGQHRVGVATVYDDMTLTEVIGMLNAPESIPIHLKHLEDYAKDPIREGDRAFDLRALRRIGDPSVAPKLLEILSDEPYGAIRREAARSLQTMGTPEAVDGLFAALNDPDIRVRKSAVLSLEAIEPEGRHDAIRAHLEREKDGYVRGPLYRLLGRTGASAELLAGYWGSPDPTDRTYLAHALGLTGSDAALPVLRRALADPHQAVTVQAVLALDHIGSAQAIHAMISSVSAPLWSAAKTAVERLVQRRERRATTAIAGRLIEVELAGVVTDPGRRQRIELLGEALVDMGYTSRNDEIAQARERQTDATLVKILDDLLARLELVNANGGKLESWIATAKSSDPKLRRMAYRWLARSTDAKATSAIVANFGRVDPGEGREILKALAGNDQPDSMALIRRVLLDPEFDGWARARMRGMAAWAARRIGGEAMFDLLVQAADRRGGLNGAVMIYLGVLGGQKALPVLARNRRPPLHALGWKIGRQLDAVDRLAQRIRLGRSLETLDVPPEELPF